MNQISISGVLSQAWELTKKNWLSILAAYIIILIVQQIISSLMGPSTEETLQLTQKLQSGKADPAEILAAYKALGLAQGPSTLVAQIVSCLLYVGLYRIVLNAVKGNGEFSIEAWKQPINTYLKFFITQIIVDVITGIGFLFCLLPGIYLYARLQFASYFIIEHQEASIGDAISTSWNMTRNNGLTLSLLFVVFILIIILGLLCCCVGVFGSVVVIYLAEGVAFYTLLPKHLDDAEPSSEYQQ